jgi:hypothetical protein
MYNVTGEFCRDGTGGSHKLAMPDHSADNDVLENPASGGGFKPRTGVTTEYSSTTPLKTCPVGVIGEQI